MIRSYGDRNIEIPQSSFHNRPEWRSSQIGELNKATNGSIYIHEITREQQSADYGWRVVGATFSQEDSTMTYFRAYDFYGQFLPGMAFGVHWSGMDRFLDDLYAFKYKPIFGDKYYVPLQNAHHTPNTGGYVVQPLDLAYPSEGLSFGMFKQGAQHQCLIISFRLFKLGENYPNDDFSSVIKG